MESLKIKMSSKFFSRLGSKRYLIPGVILLVMAIFMILELTNTTHVFHKKTAVVVSGGSFSTKGEPKKTSSNSNNSSSSGATTNDTTSSKSTASSVALITPTGDFVSNHHPYLSGSPAPNTMSSVCNTAPGVSCKIIFTMNSTVKSLPAQTTDSNGATYWNWKLQDIGLTAGSWKIQAIASANGQSKTASDAMDLVVAQ